MIIKKTKSARYPRKITFDNKRISPVPDQRQFKSDFIRNHGCSMAAFYVGLRFCGKKETMGQLLKWTRQNLKGYLKTKLTVRGVAKGINKKAGKKVAIYHRKCSYNAVKKALKNGHLVILEQGNPIHTVVLYWSNGQTYKLDHGKVSRSSAKKACSKATSSSTYRGWIDVRG